MLKLFGDLYAQIIAFSATLGVYLYLSLALLCLLATLGYCLFVVLKKNKLLNYYVNVIRTVSRSISDHLDIIAMNDNNDIIYTTRPDLFATKQEFSRVMAEKVVSVQELQTFFSMLDSKKSYGTLLSGSGTGLQNQFKKWIISCSCVEKKESMIREDVSVITISDVSKYMDQADKSIRNYEKLEKFLDNFPLGLFYINNNGIIVGANTTFANLVNISRDRLIGCAIQDFTDGFKIGAILQKSNSIVQFKPRYTQKFDAILIKSELLTSAFVQPWVVFKVEKQTATVKENGFLDQEAFIFAPVPSIVAMTSGEIKAINPAFATMIQDKVILEKKEILKLGKNILDFVHDSTREEDVIGHLQRVFASVDNPEPLEIKFTSNTVTMAYMSRIGKSRDKSDTNNLLLIQFLDISSQKLLEQQFIQSQKMQSVGQLAGGIAHDFNNLLTAMIGFCDLLLQRYTQSDPSYGDVIQIRQNAKRAAKLVRQLLAFSRQQTLSPKVVSVTEILAELSSLLKRLIGADIEFQITHGRDIWPIKVDYGQFEQVVINLCVNARDALSRNGKLTVRTRNYYAEHPFKCIYDTGHPGDYVLVEVIDTGTGIDPDIIENIFEPFFTKKNPEGRAGSGTGLGLSTVYGIVNQTGGFIRVITELGKGSNFQVFIPRYVGNEPIHDANQKQTVRDLSGSETILLVEDEDAVRTFSARALREKGYKVIEADCGEEAIKIAQTETFDLLITDVVMPKIDGPTLSKELRSKTENLQTIFISGYAEDTFRQDLDKNSNIHFLQKPFTLKDLASKVKEVIKGAR